MRKPSFPSPGRLLVRAVALLCVGSTLAASSAVAVGGLAGQAGDGADFGEPRPVLLAPLATRSIVYDGNGQEMALLYAEQDRQEVTLAQVPPLLKTAVITMEDAEFFQHHGVNVRAVGRALVSNVDAGDVEQGGSTITQQLVKNSVTGSEQTLQRKFREAVIAWQLEDQMTKDEIFERYLNTVYLGHGAYGVQAASETYFNRDVSDINWAEAALLTALIRNPSGYDPLREPELALERRGVVSQRLVDLGELTVDQKYIVDTWPLPDKTFKRGNVRSQEQLVGGNYFAEEVKQQLLDMEELGSSTLSRYDAVFKGGLRVYTTYDPDAQQAAEDAARQVPDGDAQFFAGLAAVEPATGAIRAMVGGPDFDTSKDNYVTQGWRQPGSSFKTIVLLAALEAGYVPADTISGASPCKFPDPAEEDGVYTGENNGTSKGKTASITSQTTSSSNCAYLRLGQTVGLDKVAAMADSLGISTITEDFTEIPMIWRTPITMPIGVDEVHPLAMAGAYAAIANDGVFNEPYYIDRVEDSTGAVLYQHRAKRERVMSVQTARLATDVLVSNVKSGTGRRAQLDDQVAAGKTGTTQENADAWFVGFTPQLATAVWVGSPLGRTKIVIDGSVVQGSNLPTEVWHDFMAVYHEDLALRSFPKAESTRKGKAIRYTNSADRGRTSTTTKATPKKRSTTSPTTTAAPQEPEPPVVPPTTVAPTPTTVVDG